MAMGSWLELQHWGTSFHCLIGNEVSNLSQNEVQFGSEDKASSQLQN